MHQVIYQSCSYLSVCVLLHYLRPPKGASRSKRALFANLLPTSSDSRATGHLAICKVNPTGYECINTSNKNSHNTIETACNHRQPSFGSYCINRSFRLSGNLALKSYHIPHTGFTAMFLCSPLSLSCLTVSHPGIHMDPQALIRREMGHKQETLLLVGHGRHEHLIETRGFFFQVSRRRQRRPEVRV